MLVCVRTCWCVSEHAGVCQNMLMCVRTCWCASEHVGVCQNIHKRLLYVRTYWCVSEHWQHVDVCKAILNCQKEQACVRTSCASGCVNVCQNVFVCQDVSDRIGVYQDMLVCVNTRWCGSRRFKVCQNVQMCVRTWCVSGCVNAFQNMLMCFRTCWCLSERIGVGQNVSLCVKTCLGALPCVSESVNAFQDVSMGVRTNMKTCVISERAVVSQTLSLPIWTYRHPPRCPRCTENHRYHRHQDQSCPSMYC